MSTYINISKEKKKKHKPITERKKKKKTLGIVASVPNE